MGCEKLFFLCNASFDLPLFFICVPGEYWHNNFSLLQRLHLVLCQSYTDHIMWLGKRFCVLNSHLGWEHHLTAVRLHGLSTGLWTWGSLAHIRFTPFTCHKMQKEKETLGKELLNKNKERLGDFEKFSASPDSNTSCSGCQKHVTEKRLSLWWMAQLLLKPHKGQEMAQKGPSRDQGGASEITSNQAEVLWEACRVLSHLSRG